MWFRNRRVGRWRLRSVLNAAAAHVWRACRDGASIGEMACSLAGKARGTAAAIEREVSAFCAKLSAEGLLKPSAAGAGSVAAFTGFDATPSLTIRSLAGRGGRRPTPRGNSGPG